MNTLPEINEISYDHEFTVQHAWMEQILHFNKCADIRLNTYRMENMQIGHIIRFCSSSKECYVRVVNIHRYTENDKDGLLDDKVLLKKIVPKYNIEKLQKKELRLLLEKLLGKERIAHFGVCVIEFELISA